MKKLYSFVTIGLLALLLVTSCKKESSTPVTPDKTSKTTQQLLSFKQHLLAKSGATMDADSAEWYLEGLLNFEQANNNHLFGQVDFYHDTLLLSVNNGQVSLSDLNALYTAINNWAGLLQQSSGNPNFAFDVVDLSLEPNGLKSGAENMLATLSGGILGTGLNYVPFGPEDYWYWGFGLGKCDNFSGYLGQDATTQLQYKFRNPIAVLAPGYFVSVQFTTSYWYEFPDDNNPYGNYMQFYASGNSPSPAEEPCLSPDELNYYLGKFDYIRMAKAIPGLSYKTVEVIPDWGLGQGWSRFHDYKLYYGIKIENPN